jgi:2-methylcitrate dehydratase PrpD
MTDVAEGALTRDGWVRELADVVAAISSRSLPPQSVRAATQRLLHALGVGLMSTRLPAPAAALLALEAETGMATVLGSTATRSPGAAAFVNAVAAHSSLQEDCGPGGFREGSHPGVYIVPAAVAAAEAAGASGDRLLRGVIAGYEAASRFGAAVPRGLASRRFRPVGVVGPIGAAAAAAVVLGAEPDALARALAIAANTASGFGQGFVWGSMEPYFHAGYSARNGLLAAQLALAGASAAPDALEGEHGFFAIYGGEPGVHAELTAEHPELAVDRLGSKKYAVCLQNQESLELATELASLVASRPIRAVVLSRPATSENGTASPGVGSPPPYDTMLQRQMSARFTAAAALLGRDVRDPYYFASLDERAARLAENLELHTATEDEIVVTATLNDGEELTVRGRRAEILDPGFDESETLFLSRAGRVLGDAPARRAMEMIESLPELAEIRELTRFLRATPSTLQTSQPQPDLAEAHAHE